MGVTVGLQLMIDDDFSLQFHLSSEAGWFDVEQTQEGESAERGLAAVCTYASVCQL